MKKRKAPVLLLSILVVLVGGVIIVGMRSGDSSAPQPPQPDPNGNVTQQPRQAPSSQAVGNAIATAASQAGSGPKPLLKPHQTDGPSIAMSKDRPIFTKPQPNTDGDTTSGWYRK